MFMLIEVPPCCRPKREDICLECFRSKANTDKVFRDFKMCKHCRDKALIVCKDCTPSDLAGVSLHVITNGFEVWCLDEGTFVNNVRQPAPPHLSLC